MPEDDKRLQSTPPTTLTNLDELGGKVVSATPLSLAERIRTPASRALENWRINRRNHEVEQEKKLSMAWDLLVDRFAEHTLVWFPRASQGMPYQEGKPYFPRFDDGISPRQLRVLHDDAQRVSNGLQLDRKRGKHVQSLTDSFASLLGDYRLLHYNAHQHIQAAWVRKSATSCIEYCHTVALEALSILIDKQIYLGDEVEKTAIFHLLAAAIWQGARMGDTDDTLTPNPAYPISLMQERFERVKNSFESIPWREDIYEGVLQRLIRASFDGFNSPGRLRSNMHTKPLIAQIDKPK